MPKIPATIQAAWDRIRRPSRETVERLCQTPSARKAEIDNVKATVNDLEKRLDRCVDALNLVMESHLEGRSNLSPGAYWTIRDVLRSELPRAKHGSPL